jgi:pyruvate dehydrogenase E2 component (dihydrolipoamide acetyltransferase)
MFEFKFPDVGEGITEGEIVKWRVNEGDAVKNDDVLVEVETDKAVVEIPSPRGGTIAKIFHREGDTIKVGEILVTIAEDGEVVRTEPVSQVNSPVQVVEEVKKPQPLADDTHYTSSVVGQLEEAPEDVITTEQVRQVVEKKPVSEKPDVMATPAVRRLARDTHVDLTTVNGTGHGGRVTEEDVRKAGENVGMNDAQPTMHISKKYDFFGYVDRVPLKGVRKATAEHMVKSFTTAVHVTHMDEADATELFEIRREEKPHAEKNGIHLTFMPFIIKALIEALREHPMLNASLDDEHGEIVVKKYYNIGMAVDTPDGLIAPVIKNAQYKPLLELAKEISSLSDRAQSRKLDLMDMKGSSFTITNVGSIGGLFATPVINWPDVAILAVGKIYDKVVYKDDKIVVRKTLPFSVTFDHRVVDGAEVARFGNAFKDHIENPAVMLMEDHELSQNHA